MNVRYRQAKRGSIYKIFDFEFPDKTKTKYCLLMEEISPIAETLVVVLTTHSIDYEGLDTTIRVKVEKIGGTTLIDLYNIFEIPIEILLDENKSEHLCYLPDEKMAEIDKILNKLKIPHDIWVRMQPNEDE